MRERERGREREFKCVLSKRDDAVLKSEIRSMAYTQHTKHP
jgi:hypothetical protein